ncbi:MAG: hypothetical protein RBS68_09370, partial [Anaerolineales bacterium]|nr:hypothetical protein [Anaerolineales bacterium]
TPSEIILENHLKAWKISMENMRLGGSEQLKQLYDNSRNSTLIQKINQLPINIYYLLSEKEKKNDDEIVDGLFKEYHAYLQGISRYYADHQQKIPGNINAALEAIGYLMYHEISADYYPCYKLNSRADLNIQGALIYTIDVAFSARPLPGYTLFPPVLFDFANNPELTFVISARAFDASLEPATPQRKTMKQNDLYLSAQFQAVVLPGTSTDVRINIEQGNQTLTSLLVPLNA